METVSPGVDPERLVAKQARLRDRLLGCARLSAFEQGVAAQMLLYLDDPLACWAAGASWLLDCTGADRIDGGFSAAHDAVYVPAIAHRRDSDSSPRLPSVLGHPFDARQHGIRAVWEAAQRPVVFGDLCDDGRIGTPLRDALLAAGAGSKIAVALRDRGHDIGLLCIDSRRAHAWNGDAYAQFDRLAREVIGPVLGAALELAQWCPAATRAGVDAPTVPGDAGRPRLTPAERRVAHLVLAGCSYKEIARELGRSCSTIDHQLRSMRRKLGVTSTAKLVRELSHAVGHAADAPGIANIRDGTRQGR